jgi:ketosteroid isomerase-like protein
MKRTHLYVVALAVLALATTSFAQDAKAAVDKAATKFTADLKSGNAAGIASLYAEDAMAFPPNSDIAKGRAEIQKVWQGMIDAKLQAEVQTIDLQTHGNVAIESGTYVIKDANGNVVDRGKYVVAWKRGKSGWQMHRDIWNTNMPAPAAK